jgi:hypothetical protein
MCVHDETHNKGLPWDWDVHGDFIDGLTQVNHLDLGLKT